MKRTIGSDLYRTLTANFFYPIVFCHVDWPGEAIRAHSAVGEISWGGYTWNGLRDLAGIAIPDEGAGLVPEEAEISIGGTIEAALADLADAPGAVGRAVTIWVGATTTPGGTTLIGDPIEAYSGTLAENDGDLPKDGGYAGVVLRVSGGPQARASAEIAHSDEDQQSRYPGDTLFSRAAFGNFIQNNPPSW